MLEKQGASCRHARAPRRTSSCQHHQPPPPRFPLPAGVDPVRPDTARECEPRIQVPNKRSRGRNVGYPTAQRASRALFRRSKTPRHAAFSTNPSGWSGCFRRRGTLLRVHARARADREGPKGSRGRGEPEKPCHYGDSERLILIATPV